MLTDEARARIDALPREEIVSEIAKAQRSKFQGEKFAYLRQRLAAIDQLAAAQQHNREQQVATDGNRLADEANQLGEQANLIAEGNSATGRKSYRMAALGVIAVLVAAVIALLPYCAGKP